MQANPEIGDGTQLHRQAEERQQRVAGQVEVAALLVVERKRRELSVVALQALDVGDDEFQLSVSYERAHLVHAVRRGAETVAVVDKRDLFGDRLEVQCPVEGGVAAAGDDEVLAAEGVHLADRVEHGLAFISLDAGDGRALGREASAAGRDDDAARIDARAGVGRDAPACLGLLQRLGHLAQVERRAEGLDLVHEAVGEALPRDFDEARNVVDRLLGVELRALPAWALEDVDQVGLEVQKSEFEHRKQADRTRADNGDVGRVLIACGCNVDCHFTFQSCYSSYYIVFICELRSWPEKSPGAPGTVRAPQ